MPSASNKSSRISNIRSQFEKNTCNNSQSDIVRLASSFRASPRHRSFQRKATPKAPTAEFDDSLSTLQLDVSCSSCSLDASVTSCSVDSTPRSQRMMAAWYIDEEDSDDEQA